MGHFDVEEESGKGREGGEKEREKGTQGTRENTPPLNKFLVMVLPAYKFDIIRHI